MQVLEGIKKLLLLYILDWVLPKRDLETRTCMQASLFVGQFQEAQSEEMRKWGSKRKKQVNSSKLGNWGSDSQGTI